MVWGRSSCCRPAFSATFVRIPLTTHSNGHRFRFRLLFPGTFRFTQNSQKGRTILFLSFHKHKHKFTLIAFTSKEITEPLRYRFRNRLRMSFIAQFPPKPRKINLHPRRILRTTYCTTRGGRRTRSAAQRHGSEISNATTTTIRTFSTEIRGGTLFY